MITKITYQFVLNHADLGPTTIPIENFSARLREGDAESYLQVTIGSYADYQDTVIDYMEECRTPYMTLYKRLHSADTYTSYEITTVDVETANLENGARSDSIVLTGHRATWNQNPASRTLVGVSYEKRGLNNEYDVTYRVRCAPANLVYPSDSVTYSSESATYTFTALLVSITSSSIEVSSDG